MPSSFGRSVYLAFTAAISSCSVLTTARALAAPGDLDLTLGGFGNAGVIENVGFNCNAMTIDVQGRLILVGLQNNEFHLQRRSGHRFLTVEDVPIVFGAQSANATAVAIAPDGKIVVAGQIVLTSGDDADFAVARLNTDLTLDPTFAGDGLQTSDVDGSDFANAVAVQSDKKIVVVGSVLNDDTNGDWAVERFEEDGDPDPTFDGNGKRRLGYDDIFNDARAVTMQGDKILIAGTIEEDFGLARLETTDGSFDETFGSFGDTITGFGGNDHGQAMALAPDGKIVVAGVGDERIHVARYSADGLRDATFGDDGKVTTLGDLVAFAVAVQGDGKIVVAGHRRTQEIPIETEILVLRYGTTGTLDPTFGDAGEVTTRIGSLGRARSVAVQSDGDIVVAGDAEAARYRWDGSLDIGGIEKITFDPDQTSSEVTALAVSPDVKLVAVGKVFLPDNVTPPGGYDMAFARFEVGYANGLDLAFGNSSPQTGLALIGATGVSEQLGSAAVRTDGRIIAAGQIFAPLAGTNFLVARVTEDGLPDPTCNTNGFGAADFDNSDDVAAAVFPGPGNTIYAAGTGHGSASGDDFGVARFKEQCGVDKVPGGVAALNDYKFLVDLGGEDGAAGMVVQSGVKPVLAGTSEGNIVLVRIRPTARGDLELDPGFGFAGKFVLDTGGNETAAGLVEQSDGSLIVAGSVANGGDSDFLVARFTADGQLDTTFGIDGFALASFNAIDTAHALAVRSDDTIAVAGTTNAADGVRFALAQFLPEGFLDPQFADLEGKTTLKLGATGGDIAQAVTFYGDNRLVVGGYSTVFGARQFALAAFETTFAGPSPTTTTTTTLPTGTCGDPVTLSSGTEDALVTASDALFVLRTAVGSTSCERCVCDVDDSGSIVATDALLTLKVAVGQPITLTCPTCP